MNTTIILCPCDNIADIMYDWAGSYYVQCQGCGRRAANGSSEAEAMKWWDALLREEKYASHTSEWANLSAAQREIQERDDLYAVWAHLKEVGGSIVDSEGASIGVVPVYDAQGLKSMQLALREWATSIREKHE